MLRVLVLIAIMLAVLTGVYVVLARIIRNRRWRELVAEYDSGMGGGLTREDYVARGLNEYDRATPTRLLIGILAAPLVVLLGLVLLAGLE